MRNRPRVNGNMTQARREIPCLAWRSIFEFLSDIEPPENLSPETRDSWRNSSRFEGSRRYTNVTSEIMHPAGNPRVVGANQHLQHKNRSPLGATIFEFRHEFFHVMLDVRMVLVGGNMMLVPQCHGCRS